MILNNAKILLSDGTEIELGKLLQKHQDNFNDLLTKIPGTIPPVPQVKKIVFPPEISSKMVLPFEIYADKTAGGYDFRIDYDVTALPEFASQNIIYYDPFHSIDGGIGSASNDGLTPSTPLLGWVAACNAVNALSGTTAQLVIINRSHTTQGRLRIGHRSNLSYSAPAPAFNKNVVIRSSDGKNVWLDSSDSNYAWSAVAGQTGTYQVARTTVYAVYDAAYLTAKGNPSVYKKKNSLVEVYAEEGTYFNDGTTVTVHTFGNRSPIGDSWLRCTMSIQFAQASCKNDGRLIYHNITWHSKRTGRFPNPAGTTSAGAASNTATLILSHCHSINATEQSSTTYGLGIGSTNMVMLFNCHVETSWWDAYNYADDVSNSPMKVFEYNCTANDIGRSYAEGAASYDGNISSAHQGITVVRVNTKGANLVAVPIADVHSPLSFNVGCEVTVPQNSATSAYLLNNDTTSAGKMWLVECKALPLDNPNRNTVSKMGSASVVYVAGSGNLANANTTEVPLSQFIQDVQP